MKTLLTICALAAGAGLAATSNSAQADHYYCPYERGYGYGGGYRYSAPVYNGGRYGYGGRGYDRGYYSGRYDRGRGYYRGYNRSYYGRRGGFAISTPGFGIYVR